MESVREGAGIVRGAFRMEENVRLFSGSAVICAEDGQPCGQLTGPFGKLGKCKVQLTRAVAVGSAVTILACSRPAAMS